MPAANLSHRKRTTLFVFLQLLPVLWLCRDFVFQGKLLLSTEILDMSYGWAKHLNELGWNLTAALWDRNSFCGIPFLANPATRTLYPPDLFVRLLTPISPEASFSWLIFFHLWIVGIGGSLWIGRIVRTPAARVLGGWLWIANGYVTSRTGFADPAFLFALTWIPWILYSLARLHKPFSKPILAVFLVLEVLAGRPDTTFYFAYLISGLLLWTWIPRLRIRSGRKRFLLCFRRLALVGGIALMLVAPQLLSTLDLQSHSTNRSGEASFDFSATDSLYPLQFLATLVPGCLGDPTETKGTGSLTKKWTFFQQGGGYHEVYFYLGQGTLLLAILGLWSGKGRERWYWVGVIALALLVAMGRYSPVFRFFFDWMPGWDRFRVPPRVLVLVIPAVSYLACLGLDRLIRTKTLSRPTTAAILCFLLILLVGFLALGGSVDWLVEKHIAPDSHLLLLGASPDQFKEVQEPTAAAFRQAILIASVILIAPVAFFWVGRRLVLGSPLLQWGIAGLLLADLCFFNGGNIRGITRSEFQRQFPQDPLIDAYREKASDKGRLLVLGNTQQFQRREVHPWFFPGRLFAYGVETPTGYGPFLLSEYVDAFQSINPEEGSFNQGLLLYLFYFNAVNWDVFRYFNISAVITPDEPPDPLEFVKARRYRNWRKEISRLVLLEDPNLYPRVFLYDSEDSSAYPKPSPELGSAVITLERPTEIHIEADASHPARLAHLETWFPGWSCTVNGKDCPIDKVGGTFRSVELPAGRSDILFQYRPRSWRIGVALFAFGVFGWLCLLFPRHAQG